MTVSDIPHQTKNPRVYSVMEDHQGHFQPGGIGPWCRLGCRMPCCANPVLRARKPRPQALPRLVTASCAVLNDPLVMTNS